MNEFIYGFLSGNMCVLWYLDKITTIKEHSSNLILCILIIIISGLFLSNVLLRVCNSVKHKFNYKHTPSIGSWRCLLISGAWGTGKTKYYQDNYKDRESLPDIYISCFSATKNDLLISIINQNRLWKILLLNGILIKLFENNWQQFMPKNQTIVLDDLERLHSEEQHYLDIIGIIDFLKLKNTCKIILIADITKTPQIFNTYLERVVDEVSDWQPCLLKGIINEPGVKSEYYIFTKQIANYLTYVSDNYAEYLSNRRIVKGILNYLNEWARKDQFLRNNNELYSSMLLGLVAHQIISLIKLRYVYFYNHQWFCDFTKEVHNEYMRYKMTQKRKSHPSCIKSNYERDIELFFLGKSKHQKSQDIPIGAHPFHIHYLDVKTQEELRGYNLGDNEINSLMSIYSICVNKNEQQLEREFYSRLGSGYSNQDRFTFNIEKTLDLILKNYRKPSAIDAIFSLSSGVSHLLTLRNNSNFYRHHNFWFLENNVYDIFVHPQSSQELADKLSSNSQVCVDIQSYKNYLISQIIQLAATEQFLERLKVNPDGVGKILGILYNIDQSQYQQIIMHLDNTIRKSFINREKWLRDTDKQSFNNDVNVILWLFEPNITNIANKVSQTYEAIITDIELTI